MKIILNADDFGLDDETVRATIECFEKGGLTSATIMAKVPGTQAAIDYAKSHPQFSFGVHLVYISDGPETPVCDPAEIPDLAPNGNFMETPQVCRAALRNQIPVDQIERETAAQISLLRDAGVKISHVDSHGHIHKFPAFLRALRNVLPRFGINKVRIAQNMFLRKPIKSPTFWLGPLWRRRVRKHFITTDRMFMPKSAEEAAHMEDLLPRLTNKTGALEIGVHPAWQPPWRDIERQSCQRFAALACQAGHQLITWDDLQ